MGKNFRPVSINVGICSDFLQFTCNQYYYSYTINNNR